MFSVSEDKSVIKFELSSEMTNVDRVVKSARDFVNQMGIDRFSEFKVVLRELLINAIEHGNQSNAEKKVICTIKHLDDQMFSIQVKDKGVGFDYKSLDSNMPEDPNQIRNRGFPLIFAFADSVNFNKKGNEVTVNIKVSTETQFMVEEQEGWQIIIPTGNITAAVAEKFRVLLNDLVKLNNTKFKFDLANVDDLDSIALSVFIILSKLLKKKGESELAIINAKKDLMNLFQMTKMDKSYQIESKA